MNVKGYTYLFVGLTFAAYLAIAWYSRVKDTKGFYVAGRGVPAPANGMATAADWMSAASFIGMAGLISMMGYAGGVYLMGWTGGFVLLALLVAPYLRKFGRYTVPDFIGDRFDSQTARLVAAICALFVSFTYVAGQMRGVGVVFSRFLEVDVNVGVLIGMVIVFVYATLGGMKGITWTQVVQYWVLLTAFLIPAIAISIQITGHAIPQAGLGSVVTDGGAMYLLEKLDQLHYDLGFSSYTNPFGGAWDKLNVFLVAFTLMVGTAGLPHVIVRFYTVKSAQAARWSGFWALLFIVLLYITAPAVAGFARYYMLNSLNNATEETLPGWYKNWERTGLILWLDDGDGQLRYSGIEDNEIFRRGSMPEAAYATLVRDHERWIESRGERGQDARIVMREAGLSGPDPDIIVLATPEMAQLSSWIIAFVAAGGLAAALSTASGLLLVISSSVAHDFYFRIWNQKANEKQRLLVGRAVIGISVMLAGVLGIYPPAFVGQVVAFAFGLAASSFFPAIVLGIFSKRMSAVPIIAGMSAGIGFTAFYIIGTVFFQMEKWTLGVVPGGINPQGVGAFGMLINFAVSFALMPFFKKPSKEILAMVDSIREPEGLSPVVNIEEAPEH